MAGACTHGGISLVKGMNTPGMLLGDAMRACCLCPRTEALVVRGWEWRLAPIWLRRLRDTLMA
jgi:hypothetical protein